MAQSKTKRAAKSKPKKQTTQESGGVSYETVAVKSEREKEQEPRAPEAPKADVDPRESHAQEDEAFRAEQDVTQEGVYQERDRFPD